MCLFLSLFKNLFIYLQYLVSSEIQYFFIFFSREFFSFWLFFSLQCICVSRKRRQLFPNSINLFFLIFLSFYLQMLTIFIAMSVYAYVNLYKTLHFAYFWFTCIFSFIIIILGNFNINTYIYIASFFWTTDFHYQCFSSYCLYCDSHRNYICISSKQIHWVSIY